MAQGVPAGHNIRSGFRAIFIDFATGQLLIPAVIGPFNLPVEWRA
jgi:hypothetical protein